MMVVVLPLCAGAAVGWLRNGRVRGLSSLRWRAPSLVVGAALIQLALGWLPSEARNPVVFASYITVGIWVVLNLTDRTWALRSAFVLVGAGWAMNMAAMVPNGGMPVSADALREIGAYWAPDVREGHLYKHVPDDGSALAGWLGDTIPVSSLQAVISPGDIVMAAGIVLLISSAMAEAAPRRRLTTAAS